MAELRWNPLLGEWLATVESGDAGAAGGRGVCPLCAATPGAEEDPAPAYDIVVFESRPSTLRADPPAPAVEETELYMVRPAQGACEVVLYSPDHTSSLAREPVERIDRLVRVWTDRFAQLGALEYVKYVLALDTKGAAGSALEHPHGQVIAYPFVPAEIARELEQTRAYQDRTGRCLVCDVVAEERREGRRVIAENASFVAYVPFFARWPHEAHVAPLRHVQALTDFTREEQRDLAAILKTVLAACRELEGGAFEYAAALHQRPSDGYWYDFYHFHVEVTPPTWSATRSKLIAEGEAGAGVHVNDSLAEESAARLRAIVEAAARDGIADEA